MRKIVLFIAASADGFIARKDGSIDWLLQEGDCGYHAFYKSIDTVLIGRKTYAQSLTFENVPFKENKVYVFTKKKKIRCGVNAQIVSHPIPFTKRLLKTKGKTIWLVGGAEINNIFLRAKLIDEIILSIQPIVLGSGIPLFGALHKDVGLRLLSTKVFKNGFIQSRLKVVK